jgi:type II secretory pathway predicted ATPase ExeA
MYNERYYSFFGLKYDPFIKNNSDKFYFLSSDNKEINYRLNHLINSKGFGLITGSPGLGKTTAIRNYLNTLNKAIYKIVYIPLTTLTNNDLIYHLVKELGYEPVNRKSTNIKKIQQAIIEYAEIKKMTPIIVFDEANYLSSSFLNDLKMIFNFKMDSYDNFVVLLVGLPVIISNLSVAAQEPLRQRIVMRYEVHGFSNEDTHNYITGKLEKAGGSSNIFEEGALQLIYNSSHNIPRVVDVIMSYSLLIASSTSSSVITKDIVTNACSQI